MAHEKAERLLRGVFDTSRLAPNSTTAGLVVAPDDSARATETSQVAHDDRRLVGFTPREQLDTLTPYFWTGVHWERVPGDHPRMVREPLKPEHLDRHLTPEGPYVGLAPIIPGESTTRVALLDLDSHKGETPFTEMRAIARRIADHLWLEGIHAHPFRSSGGQGIHLIMLWDEPQDAYSVREMLREVLASCGLKSGTGGVGKNQVEIFPKGDSTPAGKFGAMFILPFAGKSEGIEL